MSETPGETPVERRLREMADTRRRLVVSSSDAAAIDAGREAIALLRRYDIGVDMPDFGLEDWEDALSALLARCEETR